jgi:hypothetical protein
MKDIQSKIKYINNFGFEMSDDAMVQEKRVSEFSCLVIDNFFKDPGNSLDNLLSVPFDTGQKTLEEESRRESDNKYQFQKPMGENQLFHPNITQQLTMNAVGVLKEWDYIPNDSNSQTTPEEFERMISSCLWTGNYYYPNMTINTNKEKCHPGNFYMNMKIFLGSEDEALGKSGMSFYNFAYEHKIYYGVTQLFEGITDPESKREIMDLLNYKYVPQNTTKQYENWDGDEYFNKLIHVPAKYNRAILYPGNSWYQNVYDNVSEHYHLEGCLNLPAKEEDGFGNVMGDQMSNEMPMEYISNE